MVVLLSVSLPQPSLLQVLDAVSHQGWSKRWCCLSLTLLASILSARQLSAQAVNPTQAPEVTIPGSLTQALPPTQDVIPSHPAPVLPIAPTLLLPPPDQLLQTVPMPATPSLLEGIPDKIHVDHYEVLGSSTTC